MSPTPNIGTPLPHILPPDFSAKWTPEDTLMFHQSGDEGHLLQLLKQLAVPLLQPGVSVVEHEGPLLSHFGGKLVGPLVDSPNIAQIHSTWPWPASGAKSGHFSVDSILF